MKIKTIISIIALITATTLFYFGYCKWDIWLYIACVVCILVFMFIFIIQDKRLQLAQDSKK